MTDPRPRRPVSDDARCRATTKHGVRAGQRCGSPAVLWPVGGNRCWKHLQGAALDQYWEKHWAEFGRMFNRLGRWGVYIPEPLRRMAIAVCLEHLAAYHRRTERRVQRRRSVRTKPEFDDLLDRYLTHEERERFAQRARENDAVEDWWSA